MHRDAEGIEEKRSNPEPLIPQPMSDIMTGRLRSQVDKEEAERKLKDEVDPLVLKETLRVLERNSPVVIVRKDKKSTPMGRVEMNETPTFPPHMVVFANHAYAAMMHRSKQKLQGRPLRTLFGPSSSVVDQMRLDLHIQENCALQGIKMIVYDANSDPMQVTMDCMPVKNWSGGIDLFVIEFKCDEAPSVTLLNYWLNKNKFATGDTAFKYELSQVA